MPLIQGHSRQAIGKNIATEIHSGRPQDQAVAIAMSIAERSRKHKAGGGLIKPSLRRLQDYYKEVIKYYKSLPAGSAKDLDDYQRFSADLNMPLRGIDKKYPGVDEWAGRLDEIIGNAPRTPEGAVVYRNAPKGVYPGAENGFVSTSLSPEVAYHFPTLSEYDDPPVPAEFYKIFVPEGTPSVAFPNRNSWFPQQQEFILPRGGSIDGSGDILKFSHPLYKAGGGIIKGGLGYIDEAFRVGKGPLGKLRRYLDNQAGQQRFLQDTMQVPPRSYTDTAPYGHLDKDQSFIFDNLNNSYFDDEYGRLGNKLILGGNDAVNGFKPKGGAFIVDNPRMVAELTDLTSGKPGDAYLSWLANLTAPKERGIGKQLLNEVRGRYPGTISLMPMPRSYDFYDEMGMTMDNGTGMFYLPSGTDFLKRAGGGIVDSAADFLGLTSPATFLPSAAQLSEWGMKALGKVPSKAITAAASFPATVISSMALYSPDTASDDEEFAGKKAGFEAANEGKSDNWYNHRYQEILDGLTADRKAQEAGRSITGKPIMMANRR